MYLAAMKTYKFLYVEISDIIFSMYTVHTIQLTDPHYLLRYALSMWTLCIVRFPVLALIASAKIIPLEFI